jgi:putative ABC transport system permease protein
MTMPRTPPPIADWLLRHAVPPGVRGDTILGDLREEFVSRGGGRRAAWWYRAQAIAVALRYARSRLVRPTHPHADDRLLSEAPTMFLEQLAQDLRYAVRTLGRTPAFTAVLLATLALGIAASTAIFSLVDAIVLRPLPYPGSDRLVFAAETPPGSNDRMSVSWPNYLDWRARARSFAELAGAQANSFTLTGFDRPQRVNGRRVTASFFTTFAESAFAATAEPTVIIGDAFWRNALGADPNAVGRTIGIDGQPHTIIGVLPRGFRYFRNDDVYLRLTAMPDTGMLDRGNHQGIYALGRLRDGVTAAEAGTELTRIAAQLAQEYPNTNSGNGAQVTPLNETVVSDVRLTLLVLLGAVLFLLLIACVNVANLLVARGAARQHELAVRAALGGGRLRLVRQLLVESTFISAVGGLLGIGLAWALLQVLIALAPDGTPRIEEVRLDSTALLFALAASVACGLVFGAFPAFQASSARGQHVLVRAHGRTGAAAHSHRIRRALMIVEVALALVLLTGAGLMARTLVGLTRVDPGFDPSNVLTVRLTLVGPQWTPPKRVMFLDALESRIRSIPGVADVAFALSLPIDGSNWNSVFLVGDKAVPPRAELPSAAFTPVSTRFLQTLQIRLKRGRAFDATDRLESPKVAMVNETLARKLWPGENPIGKRVKQGWPETPENLAPWREVIGVVSDLKFEGVAAETPMQVFLPMAQEPPRGLWIVARTSGDPRRVVQPIEAAVHALDKELPTYLVRTLPEIMDGAVARERVSLVILVVFSIVALVLAAAGLYGVVAHGVTERRHEIGLRVALGAHPADVRRLFVRQGLATSAVGAAIGLVAALLLARWIEKLLFGVKPTDPMTLAAVVAALLLVSTAACYVPARRATRVDPASALRID